MNQYKISIVIPTYNGGNYIKKAIDSVLGQNYPNTELVVVDGGSKDNTVELLKNYGDKLRWVSERDEGQTDAINKGFDMISGEICAYINADDFYEPNIFFKVAEIFQNNPETVLVYGDCRIKYEAGGEDVIKPPKKVTSADFINKGNLVSQPGSFYRRNSVVKAGYFDKSINYWMDYDMLIRLLRFGNAYYVGYPTATFLVREGQKSGKQNIKAIHKELVEISRKYGGKKYSRVFFATLKDKLPDPIVSLIRKIKFIGKS